MAYDGPTIIVINRSTVWNEPTANACVAALQTQVNRDFAPVWDLGCSLVPWTQGLVAPPGAWWLGLFDTTDDAAALGYHEMTPSGTPLGKVFLKTTISAGQNPTISASHELLEMLADPWINDTVMSADNTTLYAKENCDACEDDQFGYAIDGITVSDFVYPSWFQGWRAAHSVAFDHQHKITAPFQLLSGGYIGYMTVSGGGWQQRTADLEARSQYRAHVGTRRERRGLAKQFWRPSSSDLIDAPWKDDVIT
jgi:hypothetical protein